MAANPGSVLVTGGGIIGIACAWYLRERGFDVTLIEKADTGQACSRGNCGIIGRSHVLPLTVPGAVGKAVRSLFSPSAPFRVRPQMRLSLFTWMWKFARRCNRADMLTAARPLQAIIDASADEYRRLFAETSLDAGWHESGLLYLFREHHHFDEFGVTLELLEDEFGVAVKRLPGDDVLAVEPAVRPGLAGGYFCPDDSFLRPEALAEGWASLARDAGVKIVEDCALEGIATTNGGVTTLETSRGAMQADRYVFAVGAWSRRVGAMLGCSVPVEPGKGYSMTLTRTADAPRVPIVFEERQVAATPFGDGYRLGSMMEFTGFDDTIPPFRLQQLRDAEKDYLKHPGGIEVTDTWYGWRPMTWDSLPIIGRAPRLANAILATGHNMLGVTLAAATGKLVAEIASESPTHLDAAPYSPARFAR